MAKTQTWRQRRGLVYVQGTVYIARSTIGLVNSFLDKLVECGETNRHIVNTALRLRASAEDFKLALERWRATW